jgi:hypothetical protein
MDTRFEFEGADVLALVAETHAARERLMTEAQRYVASGVDLNAETADVDAEVDHPGTGAPPGLWLMNDRGVYLRSNASTRDPARVAHARGYRGDVPVGDGAMCEFIDAAPLTALQPGDTLVLTLDEKKIRVSLIRPA